MQITKELLKDWNACKDGYSWFLTNFPQGGDVHTVGAKLREDKRFDDSRWLVDHVFDHFIKEPKELSAYVQGDVKQVLKDTEGAVDTQDASGDSAQIGSSGYYAKIGSSGDYAQIGSSGDYAQIGSSGDYAQIGSSGDYAQIGSSGDSAQIGSSGYYAKIGSSGDYAQIGSSGDYAKIDSTGKDVVIACAGSISRFRAGEGGCISAPWHDGKRTRFAVGYVGENIKADTWYTISETGEFVEAV